MARRAARRSQSVPRYHDRVRAFPVSLLLAVAALAAGCAASGPPLPPPPTPDEIVSLSAVGVPADDIIRRMREARAAYRLPASELARLHERGVPNAVIDYMQRTYIEAERHDEYLRTRERYLWSGWPSYRGIYLYGYSSPYWPP
jgi:hypothetical protein